MTSADDVLNVLRGYLGPPPIVESPPGSNRTIIGERFSQLPGADAGNGVAWCAETVSLSQHEAGNIEFVPSASCLRLIALFRDGTNGEWLGNPGVDALRSGDVAFIGSNGGDHTFTVEYTQPGQFLDVVNIDGNWSDKVTRVARAAHNIYGFGRPNYKVSEGDIEMLERSDPVVKDIFTNFEMIRGITQDSNTGKQISSADLLDQIKSLKADLDAFKDDAYANFEMIRGVRPDPQKPKSVKKKAATKRAAPKKAVRRRR